jgi:hypothetical protein
VSEVSTSLHYNSPVDSLTAGRDGENCFSGILWDRQSIGGS